MTVPPPAPAWLTRADHSQEMGVRVLHFRMQEGDFERLEGRWICQPDPNTSNSAYGRATLLRCEPHKRPRGSRRHFPIPRPPAAAVGTR